MKKTFIMMIIAIVLGGISGKLLFSKYEESSYVFSEGRNLYFLQEGVYSTKESLDNNTRNLDNKLVIPNNNKYYVYVGITGDIKNAKKIKDIYKSKGYSIYQKQIRVSNSEFINNIEQFDILLNNAKDNDILAIEEVILSNYDDLVKK